MSKQRRKRKHAIKPKPKVASDFPLSWDKYMGKWFKKVSGKKRYLGPDATAAIATWHANKDYWKDGLEAPDPSRREATFTVHTLVLQFMESIRLRLLSPARGRQYGMKPQTYREYREAAEVLVRTLGRRTVVSLVPEDFTRLKAVLTSASPHRLRKQMSNVRGIFNYGARSTLCQMGPVDFGAGFRLDSAAEIKGAAGGKASYDLSADIIRRAIQAASPRMKACILLGINCGFYSKDCSDLQTDHIQGQWLRNIREKKNTDRVAWLWPETREALKVARAEPNEWNRVLLSNRGGLLNIDQANALVVCPNCHMQKHVQDLFEVVGVTCSNCQTKTAKIDLLIARLVDSKKDLIKKEWSRVKSHIGLVGPRKGFKNLRHTYNTIGREARDDQALKLTMGHGSFDITDTYTNHVADDRVRAVGEYVRQWLRAQKCGSCGTDVETLTVDPLCDTCATPESHNL